MPGIKVDEPLDPSEWTVAQQKSVYDALAVLLNAGCNYEKMTDKELSASLQTICAEMKKRPTAVTTLQEVTQFGEDSIISIVEP